MKKTLLILLIGFFSFQSLAQDPELFKTWYLSEMWVDLGDTSLVIDVDPPISPNFTLESSLEYYGDVACNGYFGAFTYNNQTDNFTIENFVTTLAICDYDSHNDFEGQYFNYFDGLSNTIDYYIFEYGNEQTLTLEFIPGFELVYQNTPLLSIDGFQKNSIRIYPNPVSNTLYISSEKNMIERIVVYSISGKIVLKRNGNQNNSIDVSSLSKGMYFIELYSTKGKTVKKFMKK